MTLAIPGPDGEERCPTCVRPLLASAHDSHLFCPECGLQVEAVEEPAAEGEDDAG